MQANVTQNDDSHPFALRTDEAWDCTQRIIEAGLTGQTVVSKGDLAARRREWLHTEPRQVEQRVASAHRRPELATPFVAPRNEIETAVAEIFQDLLGIDAVGMNDGFFELGGHSLMAIRAVARLRETFPVDVEMRELLFKNPTAAGIARAIEAQHSKQPDFDAINALFQQVESLSEEEIGAQLRGGTVQ